MAIEHQSFNYVNFSSLKLLTICVALVFLLQFHHVSGIECGPEDYGDMLITTRILGGIPADRGNWPFIVALYHTKDSEYFCGGTLISKRHILTAAHCIQGKGSNQKLSNGDVEVRLGAYNLTAKCEEPVVLRNVTDIFVHPDWKVYNADYDADLAILALNDNVIFTKYVRPISLADDGVNFDVVDINLSGTIVGWGLTENNNHEEIPRQANVRAFNLSHCFLTHRAEHVVDLSSKRTFCAGSDEANPNRGDSGGGFFVNNNGTWRQYGIISALRSNETGYVSKTPVAVYTNVQSFESWIKNTTMNKIDLECTYRTDSRNVYSCFILDLDFGIEHVYVASVTGSHVDGKTGQGVDTIYFINGTMLSVPNVLGERFKNLKRLEFYRCFTTKLIARSNFQNLEKLQELDFFENEIEQLMFDLLWDLTALETFYFTHNALKVLEVRTFENNSRLRLVYLRGNLLEFLPRNLFKNNFLLEEVHLSRNLLKNIEIDFTALRYVKIIYLQNNTCINAYYSNDMHFGENRFTNLFEFQREIRINCGY